jgi:vacuolar-type H+-ATPase subunit H
MDRTRQVNAENLTDEQLQELSEQLGTKLKEICDKACEEANRILTVYNMKALMQFDIKPKDFVKEQGE